MRTVPKMEREIAHLNEEDFKKVFPNQYYSKYALHQKVSAFQQALLKPTHIGSHHLSAVPIQKSSSQPFLQKQTATKLTRFDEPEDIVGKSKQEKTRMQAFVKELNHKLKCSGSRSTTQLRSPLTGFQAVAPDMLDRLKFIEDAQYEAQLAHLREKKGTSYKYMNFVLRSRQQSMNQQKMSMRMDRSIIAESAQSRSLRDFQAPLAFQGSTPQPLTYNSKPHHAHSFAHANKASDCLQKAKSQIASLNPEDQKADLKCILAMNRSIRKLNGFGQQTRQAWESLRMGKSMGSSAAERRDTKARKNLMEATQNIRNQVRAIEVLSHYDMALLQRSIREKLKLRE